MVNVINEHGQVVATLPREQAEADNHATENVVIFIFNSLGRVWTQLRPKTKKFHPGRWDVSACGGVIAHENHQDAANRETKEETGLDVDLQYIESFLNIFPDDSGKELRRLSHLYIGISDDSPVLSDEVDNFKQWQPEELKQHASANQDKYVPSLITELDLAVNALKQLKAD